MRKICVPGRFAVGGPRSFQQKLIVGLKHLGVEVVAEWEHQNAEGVLLIGGTQQLVQLLRYKRQGIPIVQRLDGINWVHRIQRSDVRHVALSELRNWLMVFIRRFLADHVIYQSAFVQSWWESAFGKAPVPSTVIHNGVDVEAYSPTGPRYESDADLTFLVVETNIGLGQESILMASARATAELARSLRRSVHLLCVGNISAEVQRSLAAFGHVRYAGVVPGEQIPYYLRGSDAYISAEVNPPCPNSVVEALACGTPVVGFDSGALKELIGDGGICVPYGGDPWRLDPPDGSGLATALSHLVLNRDQFAERARRRAVEKFSLQTMCQAYLDVLRRVGGS